MQKAGCKQDKCGTYDGIPSVCLGAASVRSGDARVEAQLMYSRRVARSADARTWVRLHAANTGMHRGRAGCGFFSSQCREEEKKKKTPP